MKKTKILVYDRVRDMNLSEKYEKTSATVLKKLAFDCKKEGKIDLAIKYFSMAKLKTPFDKTIYFELGLLEDERKNYLKAIKYFMRAIRLSPDYTEAVMAMGKAHEAIFEYEMAEMIYLKILEKEPQNIFVFELLANLYLKTNDYKKAMFSYREILAINEKYAPAYYGLALCYENKGMLPDAKRNYKKCLELEPNSPQKFIIIKKLKDMKMPRHYSGINRGHLKIVENAQKIG